MGVLDDAIREHLDLKRRRGADPAEVEKAEREALGPVRREGIATSALSEAEAPVRSVSDAPPPAGDDFEFEVTADDVAAEPATSVVPPVSPFEDETDQSPAGIAAPDYPDGAFDEFAAPAAGSGVDLPPDPDFDLPADRPIAAMPEPAHKPKRRHLFGRRHHESEDFGETTPLPAELPDDDPFADDPQDMAAREAAADEAVSRAQPVRRTDEPVRPAPPPLQITPEAELGHTVEYDVEKAFAEEDEGDEDILEETPEFLADTPDHDRLWFEQKPPPDFDFEA